VGRIECEREQEVVDAVTARRWPGRADAALRHHVDRCGICADVAAVALALRDDHEAGWSDARVPSAAHVWWRAQVRARQEAAATAARPITVAQGLAAASTIGLGIGAIGYGVATAPWPGGLDVSGLRGVAGTLVGDVGVLAGSVPALALLLATALAGLVLMPLALYFVLSEK
jgi:hypothetical protein